MSVNTFRFGKKSEDIDITTARKRHVNYLLANNPRIITPDGNEIVHSLYLDRGDLEDLFDKGQLGLRLYFCKEEADNDSFNIILVPVGENGENDINPGSIFNTLEPCPDKCPPIEVASGDQAEQDVSFSVCDLNYIEEETEPGRKAYFWYKPNNPDIDGKVWYDRHKQAVDDPRAVSAVATNAGIEVTYCAFTGEPDVIPSLKLRETKTANPAVLELGLYMAQEENTGKHKKIKHVFPVADKHQYNKVAVYIGKKLVKEIRIDCR